MVGSKSASTHNLEGIESTGQHMALQIDDEEGSHAEPHSPLIAHCMDHLLHHSYMAVQHGAVPSGVAVN